MNPDKGCKEVSMKERIIVAIGGNAISKEGEKGTIKEQRQNIVSSLQPILGLVEKDFEIVITHGNGPQVGNALIKEELAKDIVPPYPLDVLNAETQGSLGYLISQGLHNCILKNEMEKQVVTIITQVVVDKEDRRFKDPSKPVGPFYTQEEAERLGKGPENAKYVEDSGRGYRRVVPSPLPLHIIEKDAVESLLKADFLVICAGGGGIPVTNENGYLKGVEAVIDKDFASALLAAELKADYYFILTGVEQVAINFGKPDQENILTMTVSEAKRHLEDGQFPKGSMGPKIEAAIYFLEKGGKNVVITSLDKVEEALQGKTGTRIVPEGKP
jgi:carbamate kinase